MPLPGPPGLKAGGDPWLVPGGRTGLVLLARDAARGATLTLLALPIGLLALSLESLCGFDFLVAALARRPLPAPPLLGLRVRLVGGFCVPEVDLVAFIPRQIQELADL